MKAVEVRNLKRSYDKVEALRGVSFSVDEGELFGIIGPDGAGKTTLFRVLTTLLLPDEGEARIDGSDIIADFKSIRQKVGYMPGRFSLYQDLTVEENLTIFASIFNTSIAENYYLIEKIYRQIEPFKKRKAGALSGGMKQKLALSCALIHKPVILFLDEPTTGVDPVSRKEFWEMLFDLKAQGITILVSTPYMDEAGKCDRIALIQNGQFLKIDTPKNIVSDFSKPLWSAKASEMSVLLKDIRSYTGVESCYAFGDKHHVTFKNNDRDEVEELSAYLKGKGHPGITLDKITPTIEDCFMELEKQWQ
jgi:ABC-type multidrug transport system ATPase subunit